MGSAEFNEGYEEGKLIGRLECIIDLLKSENAEDVNLLDELIQDGVNTEVQKEQALFYIRMGIFNYDGKKKRGEDV